MAFIISILCKEIGPLKCQAMRLQIISEQLFYLRTFYLRNSLSSLCMYVCLWGGGLGHFILPEIQIYTCVPCAVYKNNAKERETTPILTGCRVGEDSTAHIFSHVISIVMRWLMSVSLPTPISYGHANSKVTCAQSHLFPLTITQALNELMCTYQHLLKKGRIYSTLPLCSTPSSARENLDPVMK